MHRWLVRSCATRTCAAVAASVMLVGAIGCRSGNATRVAGGTRVPNDAPVVVENPTSDASDDAPSRDWGFVTGSVVDFSTKRALTGRAVFIGGQSTQTDDHGRFALRGVSAPYDAIVVDPDRSTVSLYIGLNRSDLVLVHVPSRASGRPMYAASLTGNVSGGGPYPLGAGDPVTVIFFSPETDSHVYLGSGFPTGAGPSYALGIRWNGQSTTSGQLSALRTLGASADGGSAGDASTTWFASQMLTVGAASPAVADLTLSPVPSTRVSGTIAAPSTYGLTELDEYYQLPIPNSHITVRAESTSGSTFDQTVPDLTAFGATLCIAALHATGVDAPVLETDECGASLVSSPALLTLQSPPSLLAPIAGSSVTTGTPFSWTRFDNGVHLLELQPSDLGSGYPNIYVFTMGSRTAWPDLNSMGIAFPGGQAYRAAIAGLGPFTTMDDALGPAGLGAWLRAETRQTLSAPTDLLAAAP